jgi:hypothetical protein
MDGLWVNRSPSWSLDERKGSETSEAVMVCQHDAKEWSNPESCSRMTDSDGEKAQIEGQND